MEHPHTTTSDLRLCVGIFETESGQRFLHGLERLVHAAFSDLWARLGTSASRYASHMKAVSRWSERLVSGELVHVYSHVPDFDARYEDAVYAMTTAQGTASSAVPSNVNVVDFARRFLIRVSQTPPVVSGDYHTAREVVIRKLVCMDCARLSLAEMHAWNSDDAVEDNISPDDSVSNC